MQDISCWERATAWVWLTPFSPVGGHAYTPCLLAFFFLYLYFLVSLKWKLDYLTEIEVIQCFKWVCSILGKIFF